MNENRGEGCIGRELAVVTVLKSLDSITDEINDVVCVLENRLRPVLKIIPSAPLSESEKSLDSILLAERVAVNVRRLGATKDLVNTLINRLEL